MAIRSGDQRLGLIGWVLLAASLAAWLMTRSAGASPWHWLAAYLPWLAFGAAMLTERRHAYAYALLGTIGYAIVAVTDLVSLPPDRWPAAIASAGAISAFFMLLPATRRARREETRERTES